MDSTPSPGHETMPSQPTSIPPHRLTARQLAEHQTTFSRRHRDRFAVADRDVFGKIVRRVEQHERLLSEVVPDLCSRLTVLAAAAIPGPSGSPPIRPPVH
jgi:hypothetical protein